MKSIIRYLRLYSNIKKPIIELSLRLKTRIQQIKCHQYSVIIMIHSDLLKSLNLFQVLQLQLQGRRESQKEIKQQYKQIEQKIDQQIQNVKMLVNQVMFWVYI
ncbi:hypothetical protein pb186bvf_010483 [Paramecium bursaria]